MTDQPDPIAEWDALPMGHLPEARRVGDRLRDALVSERGKCAQLLRANGVLRAQREEAREALAELLPFVSTKWGAVRERARAALAGPPEEPANPLLPHPLTDAEKDLVDRAIRRESGSPCEHTDLGL